MSSGGPKSRGAGSGAESGGARTGGEKLISQNSAVRADYFIEELVEAGIVLQGTEVKSIRVTAPGLKECYVDITAKKKRGVDGADAKSGGALEAWLMNLHLNPYSHGNIWNHETRRPRKLLLHSHQLRKMLGALTQEGKTIVPTRMYFKAGRVKLELAIVRGKNKGDKREDVKRRTSEREMAGAMKRGRR